MHAANAGFGVFKALAQFRAAMHVARRERAPMRLRLSSKFDQPVSRHDPVGKCARDKLVQFVFWNRHRLAAGRETLQAISRTSVVAITSALSRADHERAAATLTVHDAGQKQFAVCYPRGVSVGRR
jgi:hypothetical protein